MRIGILLAGHFLRAETGGNPDHDALFRGLLAGHGFTFRTWAVVDMDFPESPEEADGWIITGSKHGVYDDLAFIAKLEDFIRAAFAANRPMVGICFGHQIIAQAMGGTVVKFPGGWGAGHSIYDFHGETVPLVAWHQDQVVEPPDTAEVIATSTFCEYAALLYGANALTIQAHPEYGRGELSALIDIRGPTMDPDVVSRASANIDAPIGSAEVGDKIAAFFKVAHG
ncbi:MAG: type 1 glutamine amidotransferase [Paracoccaceae bacterium]|nr:type 1 glutamine amidotransferase [Paracoccaceae bacterium]